MARITGKVIMVMLESMAGTGHKYVRMRPRLADKMERVLFDPTDRKPPTNPHRGNQQAKSEPQRMFVIVKYGDNRSLVCNPMCSVINLLTSIKSRTGYGGRDMIIDIADETGLIKDLEIHGRDYATKHLTSHNTYILMEKQVTDDGDDAASSVSSKAFTAEYNYIPLLEKYRELYPNFRVHLSDAQKRKLKPLRNVAKSPSPAGKMGTKSQQPNKSGSATKPPRSSSRGRKN